MLAAVLGGITFILASTGTFLELQAALNTIWRAREGSTPPPEPFAERDLAPPQQIS